MSEDDVAELNRITLQSTARFVRYGGMALMGLAAFAFAAWLWVVLRQQQALGLGGFIAFNGDRELSLTDRIDLFAQSIGFLTNLAIVGGLGIALRLLAESIIARTGGSLTGLTAGGQWPDDDDFDNETP